MRSYEELRRRQVADLLAMMPEHVARLGWSRLQIDDHRRRALRRLLGIAKRYSAWHRRRLRDIDPARATEADLEKIEPMTRADLMEHWDEIVIYPDLCLTKVERHLAETKGDAFLLDAFHAVASEGARGRRGVFVYDWDGWVASYAGCARWRLRNRAAALGSRRPCVALVGSGHSSHISGAILQTFAMGRFHRFSADQPIGEVVAGLNRVQPDVLLGYPSALRALAEEAASGRLGIRPAYVNASGEPLDDELHRRLETLWDARVNDGWSAAEAFPLAQQCGAGAVMHVNDDLVVVEPVDLQGRRVLPGERSDEAYVTNLFNLALPLIRYELTDQVTPACASCPCGSAFSSIEGVRGRLDDRFVYDDGTVVDPSEIGSVLAREKNVFEYQVLQTPAGAEVRVRSSRPLHLRAVAQRVASALGKHGVASPTVRVHRVHSLERGPAGKLRRFVPSA